MYVLHMSMLQLGFAAGPELRGTLYHQLSVWMQIMIAEAGSRRKGIAREALLIMMAHARDRLVRPSRTVWT